MSPIVHVTLFMSTLRIKLDASLTKEPPILFQKMCLFQVSHIAGLLSEIQRFVADYVALHCLQCLDPSTTSNETSDPFAGGVPPPSLKPPTPVSANVSCTYANTQYQDCVSTCEPSCDVCFSIVNY